MKFDKSQDLSWNALVTLKKAQCILAGSKQQKKFFASVLFEFNYCFKSLK